MVGCWAHCRRYFFEAAVCKYKIGLEGLERIRTIYAADALLAKLPPSERTTALLHWSEAPYARNAHPREEHLLPLMVALGAAEQEDAACVYHEDEFFGHLAVSSFRFGAPLVP